MKSSSIQALWWRLIKVKVLCVLLDIISEVMGSRKTPDQTGGGRCSSRCAIFSSSSRLRNGSVKQVNTRCNERLATSLENVNKWIRKTHEYSRTTHTCTPIFPQPSKAVTNSKHTHTYSIYAWGNNKKHLTRSHSAWLTHRYANTNIFTEQQ